MLDDQNPRAVAGGNNPPPFRAEVVEDHAKAAADFLDAAGQWIDKAPLTSAEQSAKLNDFTDGLKKKIKAVDEDRKADKKPHDDAGRAVQTAYSPIIEKLKAAASRVGPLQTAWLQKVEAEQRAEAERQRKEAAAAAKAAEEAAAKAAARNDISGEVEAEAAAKRAAEMQKEADRAAKAKAQAGSATGGARTASMRKYVTAEVTDMKLAFMTMMNEPDLQRCLIDLAQRRARAKDFDAEKDKIPGFALHVEKRAV